jgi:hypothetical protein
MDRRFSAGEWVTLSVEERIRRCRLMAEEAMTLAVADHTSVRQHYIDLAKQWADLADEMQAQITGPPTP